MQCFICPDITSKTPLEEVMRIHRRIWNYVIEHGEKPDTQYLDNCVLCEYAVRKNAGFLNKCSKCPAIWPDNDCYFDHGLYSEWKYYNHYENIEKAKEYAEKIRDIPFKEEQ